MVTGHRYNDPVTDTECIEFHVDDHDCMQDLQMKCTAHTVATSVSVDLLTVSLWSSLDKTSQSSINSHLAQSGG
jgi:hypothetical protein